VPQVAREMKIVEVVVDPEITPEQITDLIFQVGSLGLGGDDCRHCGLVGFDLRLSGQNREIDLPSGARSIVIS
jgi:hypothetical protein